MALEARPPMTPLAMLLPCVTAMAAGLVIDARAIAPEALAALCVADGSLLGRTLLHWRALPAAHGLMLLAAAATVVACERHAPRAGRARRAGAHVGCLAVMLLGMALAQPLSAPLVDLFGGSGLLGMSLAMAFGMAAGGVLGLPLYRFVHPAA